MLTVIVMRVMVMMMMVVVVVAVTMIMMMAVVVDHWRAFAESSVRSISCLTIQIEFLRAAQGAGLPNLQPTARMVATLATLLLGLSLIGRLPLQRIQIGCHQLGLKGFQGRDWRAVILAGGRWRGQTTGGGRGAASTVRTAGCLIHFSIVTILLGGLFVHVIHICICIIIIITGLGAGGMRSDGNFLISVAAVVGNVGAIYACFLARGVHCHFRLRCSHIIITHRLAVTVRYHILLLLLLLRLLILTSFGFHDIGQINPMATIIAHALDKRLKLVGEGGKGLSSKQELISLLTKYLAKNKPHRLASKWSL